MTHARPLVLRAALVRRAALVAAASAAVSLTGCGLFKTVGLAPNDVDPDAVRRLPAEREEPQRVAVRHVLVSFDESGIAGVTRTKAEAERLANQVLALARAGRDFGELVRLYSDDRHGDGAYVLTNWGVAPHADEQPREGMVRGFGRTAFSLEPGQVGLCAFQKVESPYGWHVIRRDR